MEIRQLKYFLAVADARSFVSAAQTLYISRQAVSKAISQLEEEMDVELFMRDSNGAFLTPAGIMFYDRIRAVIMELDGIREEMERYGKRYSQRVRLAFSIGTIHLYEQALLEFGEEQKNVQIEYSEYPEELCASLLLENKADVIISTAKPRDPMITVDEMYSSHYGVLLRRDERLEEVDDVALDDLTWIPLAGLSDQQTARLSPGGLTYSGYDYHRLFSLTRQGACALLLPECLAPHQWEDLIWRPLKPQQNWTLYCSYLQSLEKNILYRTIVDELQIRVFEKSKEATSND